MDIAEEGESVEEMTMFVKPIIGSVYTARCSEKYRCATCPNACEIVVKLRRKNR